MAILNGLQGQAHVESKGGLSDWIGYITLAPVLLNAMYFDITGPASRGVYEGPAMMKGSFYLVYGDILVKKVTYSSAEFRIDFVGNGEFIMVSPLSEAPDDYLP